MALTKVSTGMLSADAASVDLNIDAGTMFIDASANRVGIGNTSPDSLLELETAVTNSTGGLLLTNTNASGYSTVQFKNTGGTAQTYTMALGGSSSAFAQKLYIYDDTDAAARVVLDHSGNVGIGTSSPDSRLVVQSPDNTLATDIFKFTSQNGAAGLKFGYQRIEQIGASTPITFNTGGSESMRIAASGNVGIGSTAADRGKLHVNHIVQSSAGAFSDPHIALSFSSAPTDNDSFAGISYATSDSDNYGWTVGAERTSGGVGDFIFTQHNNSATGSEKVRIDSSGNVGIGTGSPADLLHIEDSSAVVSATQLTLEGRYNGYGAGINFVSRTSSGGTRASMAKITADGEAPWDTTASNQDSALLFFTTLDGVQSEALRINAQGNIKFDTASSAIENGTGELYLIGASNIRNQASIHTFSNSAGSSEYARFDSSGNLLVGTSDAEPYNNNAGNTDDNGIVLSGGGWLASSRFNGVAAYFNRTNTTGDVVTINYNGATKGTIGSDGSILYIGSGEGTDAYLGFGNDIIRPVTSTGASRDNAIDLGYVGMRFKNLYLSNTISLSNASTSSFIQVSTDVFQLGTSSNDPVAFYANNVERMRIKSDGDTVFGDGDVTTAIDTSGTVSATSNAWSWSVKQTASSGDIFGSIVNFTGQDPNNTTSLFHAGVSSAGTRYAVYSTGGVANTGNSYGALSDVKLKENIQDASSQWDDLKAVRVRKYSLKEEEASSPTQIGVIAQEVEEAGMGGLVFEAPDIDIDTKEVTGSTKHVKYSILYMKAIKALQEAMDRIETLEAKVAQLEGAN